MNSADIIVFDYETGSVDPTTTIPLSLSAMVYNPRSLEPVVGATFDSLMKPKDSEWSLIEDGALKVNGLTREELREAPDRDAVWKQFVSFVNAYRKKGFMGSPIPAGQNIKGFDLIISDRLCREHGQVDKDGKPNLWNRRHQIDLLDIMFMWFEGQRDGPPNYKFDTLRDYFGLSKEGAHTSKTDVEQTGEVIMRFLKLHRKLFQRVPGLKGVATAVA